MDRIRARSYTDNVVDLMVGRLKRFSVTTQDAMKEFACLGNVVDIAKLALVHGRNRAGDARGALGGRPHRARLPPGERLQIPARPHPSGGLFTDSRRAPCRSPLANWPRASRGHDGGPTRRASVRCRRTSSIEAPRLVDRDEKAQVATITFAPAERPRRRRPMRRLACILLAGMALLDERDWGSQYELTFSLGSNGRSASF